MRINKLQIDYKSFTEKLQERNIPFTQSTLNEFCIKVDILPPFGKYEVYRKGWVSDYDETSALAVALLNPQYGESVISLCAATTGKTLHVAEVMNNTGKITAVDLFDARSKRLLEEAKRTGVINVSAVTADPLAYEAPIADRVLIDAPNSNSGAFDRFPDQKWKCSSESVELFNNYQMRLLRHAAQLVKPGGVIVYATHSIAPEENRDVITAFLNTDSRFAVDPPGRAVKQEFISRDGFVETFQHIHHVEGSFAARLLRK